MEDITNDSYAIRLNCGRVIFAEIGNDTKLAEQDDVNVFVRPEYFKIETQQYNSESSLSDNCLQGTISERIFGGGNVYVKVQIDDGDQIEISMNNDSAGSDIYLFNEGKKVDVHWRTDETLVFPH